MTLDEGIIHAEDVARIKHEASIYLADEHPTQAEKCEECAEEHSQLAEWLKELKAYKENTCGDAISRQAVIELCDVRWLDDFAAEVRALPSVTPQQRSGQWIINRDSIGRKYGECSECMMRQYVGTLNYCPNCGARMEVEDAD